MFECDLEHRRSVAVLSMLYKIRCNPMDSLYGAVPVMYVPVRVTRGAVIEHRTLIRLLAAETRSIAGLLFPSQYLCGTVLVTPYWIVWDLRVSRADPMLFIGLTARSLFVSYCFQFLFFHSMGWYCGAGVVGR